MFSVILELFLPPRSTSMGVKSETHLMIYIKKCKTHKDERIFWKAYASSLFFVSMVLFMIGVFTPDETLQRNGVGNRIEIMSVYRVNVEKL